MTGFRDMLDTVTIGSPTAAGGVSPQAQAFAKDICTKLGACQALNGHEVAVPSTGRSR